MSRPTNARLRPLKVATGNGVVQLSQGASGSGALEIAKPGGAPNRRVELVKVG